MAKQGLRAYAEQVAGAGRHGDTELAHLSPDEIAVLNSLQGHVSINPVTGLPEYFSLGKILKGVAKAAGALAGGYFGGPAGAAVGAGAVSALMGDSTGKALTTGLLAGLGSYGAQQSGLGDYIGGGFSSGADLLGQSAADAGIQTASAAADSVASSGGDGGFSLSSILPAIGLSTAALGAAAYKPPKVQGLPAPEDIPIEEYEPLDREQIAYGADPYTYGVFGPEFQYFDEVNPAIQPMRDGGRVHLAEGGIGRGGRERSDFGHERPSGTGSGNRGGSDSRSEAISDRRASQASANAAAAARTRETQSIGTGRGNATIADRMIMDRYLGNPEERIKDERSYWDAVRNLGRAANDYQNRGQGFTQDPLGSIGRALGSMLGIGEIDPTTQPLGARAMKPEASWGIDPLGAALGLAGAAGLTPIGLGALYQGAKSIAGYQGPMISFDEYDPITNWTGRGVLGNAAGAFGGSSAPSTGMPRGGNRGDGRSDSSLPIRSIGYGYGAVNDGTADHGKIRDKVITDRDRTETETPTGRTYIPLADVYNYGVFGPEHSFFTGDLNMRHGGDVRGPGDGQSDDIPAMLSDGEYVIDAETVSALGDGSTDAGAKKLDDFRKNLRKHKRKSPAHKIPAKAKSISAYMRSAA